MADKRGRHLTHKVTLKELELVEQHVRSIPSVSSHYTRAKSPHGRYLDSSLSVPKLFDVKNLHA